MGRSQLAALTINEFFSWRHAATAGYRHDAAFDKVASSNQSYGRRERGLA
jgi:hypothetical protein